MTGPAQKEWGCPHCGNSDPGMIVQIDSLDGRVDLMGFDEEGQPEFAGYTEIIWDSAEKQGFWCDACDDEFPDPVRVDGPDVPGDQGGD